MWIGRNTLLLFPAHLLMIYGITNVLVKIQLFHWMLLFIILSVLIVPVINIINMLKNYIGGRL